ncbi:MAG: sigma-54-dependent Fis family transcriptional regulator [Planctomycetaceae bacterium]|nr:MAG: sigma-54-dependent Fis family transcriptional regulator [Planctomycetaceae bacterium]
MNQITRLSAVDSTVFIGGESGTGKSTVARMIHQQSHRRQGPFVSINCASLPRDLLTSELFGHTKGSFTGAVKDRAGHAEVADGGTLFLDEIGDLPLELQPKLLTFLQDRTVQRLGSSDVRKVDVRLIVATHRDLTEMCREQAFRQDLYFRLMVLSIEIPPLRHRSAELPSMAEGILARICERMATEPKRLTAEAIRLLLQHSWPGNIRELENVLERAVAFSSESEIKPKDLLLNHVALVRSGPSGDQAVPEPIDRNPHELKPSQDPLTASLPADALPHVGTSLPQGVAFSLPPTNAVSPYSLVGKTLDEIERDAIIHTLSACRGNKAQTARVLGISEKSIYNKMRRLAIDRFDAMPVS